MTGHRMPRAPASVSILLAGTVDSRSSAAYPSIARRRTRTRRSGRPHLSEKFCASQHFERRFGSVLEGLFPGPPGPCPGDAPECGLAASGVGLRRSDARHAERSLRVKHGEDHGRSGALRVSEQVGRGKPQVVQEAPKVLGLRHAGVLNVSSTRRFTRSPDIRAHERKVGLEKWNAWGPRGDGSVSSREYREEAGPDLPFRNKCALDRNQNRAWLTFMKS